MAIGWAQVVWWIVASLLPWAVDWAVPVYPTTIGLWVRILLGTVVWIALAAGRMVCPPTRLCWIGFTCWGTSRRRAIGFRSWLIPKSRSASCTTPAQQRRRYCNPDTASLRSCTPARIGQLCARCGHWRRLVESVPSPAHLDHMELTCRLPVRKSFIN